jgi:polar amino acid transport system substrate-binding protein
MRFITLTLFLLAACVQALAAAATTAPLQITTEHSPPSSMRDADGAIIGRATDKVRELMARSGTEYSIEQLPWKRAFLTAQTQQQGCVYSTSRTPEREALFKWVGPTDEAEWQFWGRADHKFQLNSIEDARKLRIGTYIGDARDDYLRSRGFQVDAVSNDLVNPQKLLLGRIDLWAVATRNGSAGRTQFSWSDQVVPLLVFHRVKVYLACNPAVPDELIDRLNATLADMRRDGTLARIDRKYENWGR